MKNNYINKPKKTNFMNCQIYKFEPSGKYPNRITISDALEDIKSGKYKKVIAKIRQLEKSDPNYEQLKNGLPHYTFSGTIQQNEKESNVIYSQIVVLDIDDIDDVAKVRKKVEKDPYTAFVFISTGGKGLKIGVKVNTSSNRHEEVFNKVCNYYEEKYNLTADRSGIDVSKASFCSYDPDAYLNERAEWFKVKPQTEMPNGSTSNKISKENFNTLSIPYDGYYTDFDWCENKHCNDFAERCIKRGVSLEDAISFYIENYSEPSFDKTDIKWAISEWYRLYEDKFGSDDIEYENSLCTTNKMQRLNRHNRRPALKAGPKFDGEVRFNQPEFIVDILKILSSDDPYGDQNGPYLIATLTMLSSLLPKCYVILDGNKYNANLYTLLITQGGDAKQIIKDCKSILKEVDREMSAQKYNKELGLKNDIQRGLFLTQDESEERILDKMQECGNLNLLINPEIETTPYFNNNQDWDSFSDKLRQIHEHETIISNRGDKPQTRIEEPALSMLLGTSVEHLRDFDNNIERGLTSIIAPFSYRNDDPTEEEDRGNVDRSEKLKIVQSKVKEFFEYNLKFPFTLDLTEESSDKTDDGLNGTEKKPKGEDVINNAKLRRSVIEARLHLIFAAIDRFKESNQDRIYTQHMGLGRSSFWMCGYAAQAMWEHQLVTMEYQGVESLSFSSRSKGYVFDLLRDSFTPDDMHKLAQLLCRANYSKERVQHWLKEWEEKGHVKRGSLDQYFKQ